MTCSCYLLDSLGLFQKCHFLCKSRIIVCVNTTLRLILPDYCASLLFSVLRKQRIAFIQTDNTAKDNELCTSLFKLHILQM